MRIDRLHLKNFRCYDDMEFAFSPQFNLIVGENGAGKTAVLNGLAVAMGSWFLGIRGYDSRHIQDNDIRRIVRFVDKKFLQSPQFPVSVSAVGSIAGRTLAWERTLEGPGGRTTQKKAGKIKAIAEEFESKVMKGEEVILPVISFYGAGRLWNEPKDTRSIIEKYKIRRVAPQDFATDIKDDNDVDYFSHRFTGYHYSVDDRCSPKDLLRWMRHERRIEIDEEEQSSSFRMVLSAIQSCLPENEKVRYSIKHGSLMITMKDKSIVPFHYLSDGYKNIIALVGDIAYKISQLNPRLGAEALHRTPGIVLIDELDEHLHPKWQRRVVSDLRRTFKAVQFFGATHSPQIIGEVASEEVTMLKNHRPVLPSQSFGMDSNWILQVLMGADEQDPDIKEELHVVHKLISDKKLVEADKMIYELRQRIGNNEALQRAASTVERVRVFGR
ncbi:AAA family ATPase [Geomesophilobacter sediminis]|uniref:AAA family ATPase n=1 Tax=Geomesophilobacter sediminis TaxID=2798584 RepID=A0A8J7M3N9_9BACT|nr:AAA family ATPase [Geomesophilobacter sediminis]MBJ6727578.1 AAA family ATPase [Geomesophilobacter sediminis]